MLKAQAASPALPAALPAWEFSPHPAVEQAVRDVYRRHPILHPDKLERMRRLLQALGDPQLKLPYTFHVAGTNGKGSTLAFLQAVFEAEGLATHKFISPHLVRFEERITIAGQVIGPEDMLPLIDEVAAAADKEPVSFFEFFTAVAFLAFARKPAAAVLLETGMGGIYDATNLVPAGSNLVSLITRISYDHTHILGNTLSEISGNKAGIIKAESPVVIAPQAEEALGVFKAKIHETQSPAAFYGDDWQVTPLANGFEYKSGQHHFVLPWPRLQGLHQIYNAGLALAALEKSPYAALLEQKILEQAMKRVDWPGRLQHIKTGPLAALLPAGWELWLDGAHNDSGAEVLADQAKLWGQDKPLHLIAAMKKSKDADMFYRRLLPHTASVQAVETLWHQGGLLVPAKDLCAKIRASGGRRVQSAANLESAIRALTFEFKAPQRILVTGSLFLVGRALQESM